MFRCWRQELSRQNVYLALTLFEKNMFCRPCSGGLRQVALEVTVGNHLRRLDFNESGSQMIPMLVLFASGGGKFVDACFSLSLTLSHILSSRT